MKDLLKKLSKVKSEIGKISKDKTNPFFKSKFFDINTLLEHTEPLLEKYGLLLLQPIRDGKVISFIYDVETGDSEWSGISLPDISDPQKLGSAITYYRRYTLQSLLGLQAEDDDGNKASKRGPTNLQIAKADADGCDSIVKLESVWNENAGLQNNNEFKNHIKNLKIKFK